VYILLFMTDPEITPNERERIAAMQFCVNNNLRSAARIVSSFYDQALSSTGLHANQGSLLVPLYLLGPLSISQMAEGTGLDRTTLVRNLKLLEDRSLITITTGQDDQRMRIVALTPQGREALVAALPLWEEAQRQAVELLGPRHSEFMNTLSSLSELGRTP
jgi:DNA-binding MarR family transcriptional regulator